MTVLEALKDSYSQATGKASDLTISDTKGAKLMLILNRLTQRWGEEDWRSMRAIFSVASTVSATNTFAIPATLHHTSKQEGDFVRIEHADGVGESDYSIVPIEQLYDDGVKLGRTGPTRCAIVGSNLVFDGAFTADDDEFGGTIKIPGYSIPTTLSAGSDTIEVDDPYWLTTAAAAEFVFTDRTRVQLYDTLKARADERWYRMKLSNNSQIEAVYTGGWTPLAGTD